jgi:hypothetical protein
MGPREIDLANCVVVRFRRRPSRFFCVLLKVLPHVSRHVVPRPQQRPRDGGPGTQGLSGSSNPPRCIAVLSLKPLVKLSEELL